MLGLEGRKKEAEVNSITEAIIGQCEINSPNLLPPPGLLIVFRYNRPIPNPLL